ncbi:helix-turn-helix domain-containing protein [Halalkalibacter alkaliphilus]|uniref:Helix-turn-helix domain-containing protein n=1 Tax=Halalkalibacter alkaliphilus TaxID=2917993 RepID=A0A9X2CWU6_9BACI|nr:helix-turn-helix domain-containing protein [Halalkalibacter alkaliphilus]
MVVAFEADFSEVNKICNLLHSVTKMDVRFIENSGTAIVQLANLAVPAAIQNLNNDISAINEVLKKNASNSYYFYINSYGLEYIASGVWHDTFFYGAIMIGPFLSRLPSIDFISDIIANNNLPISERKQIHEFYQSLSVISSTDSNSIGDLIVNLCNHKHIDSQLITSEISKANISKEELRSNIADSKDVIEFRYHYEKKIMNSIAKGDKKEVERIAKESSSIFMISDRIPESPIRSLKNISLVLNTICRIAAERGGVHPVYVHTISEKFAILIERAPNLPHLKKLGLVMMTEYCELVHEYSTSKYSSIVKKAIDLIDLNIDKPLTLSEIAETIHVNSSHLSRQFKKDTDMTIIDFINKKRVEEAKLYLQRGNISVTEVAFMVGFNDLNYFSRVFKKFASTTPSQYMKEVQDF